MKKVGVMGGTFNPIHNGHLMLAKKAVEQYVLDEVIFMPCGYPYKKEREMTEPKQARAEMTALAIRDIPDFLFSAMEIEKEGKTYTYETMERLKRENPDTDYYFILGADNLFQIESWVKPERIFACCSILAAVRDGKTKLEMNQQIVHLKRIYRANVLLLTMDDMPVSSSEIRRKVAAGEKIDEYVPQIVREYIEKNGLYQ